ncbi:PREDICTED: WW domain-containing adapter protein with coiled-coil-like [Branchiostoma belcheri]|uniref:WW domain-containing adapter protein with coiled-coil-like n=1 Tax=Branchiostoma belcheri TaxID=7741 RepID=A0A6P4Y5B0_BRABE|nr:PREDICTED: WW domain-containing adapter protein with coiled-coil-like [Branchiostoma belcheri]
MHGNIRGLTMGTTTEARPIPTRLLVWESTHPSVTAAAPIMTTTTGLTECGIRPARFPPHEGQSRQRNSPWESRDRERERERERDRERDRDRDRYKNKSSYSERYREKERERERRERERARYSPGDWDRPHRRDREDRRGTSDSPAQNAANHQPRQSNSSANHSQTQPQTTDRKNDNDAGKKNAEHTQSSTASTSTAAANTKAYRKVQGDWSEHISSSGKKYYYNCKTEVSQWEKPPGWQESPKDSGESKHKDKPVAKETASSSSAASSASHGTNSREAGSSSATGTPSSSNHKHSTDPSPRPATQPASDRHKDTPKSHNRTGTPSSSQGTPSAHRGTPGQGSDRMDISTTPEHLQTIYTRSRTESPAVQNTPSPGTPSLGRSHTTPHSIPPSLVQQLFPPTSSASSISQVHNVGVEQSLQLLQHATMLTQQALQAQQQQPTTTVPPSNVSDSSPVSMRTSISDMSSPYQSQLSPQPSSSQQGEVVTSSASPAHSVHSQKSVGSHADGAVSSSYAVVHSSTPTAAHTVLPPSIELTPALVKYYKETLIRHTQGWQAEHAERQAQRLDEEGHAMGSLHSSQVSVDLKFARSLVRVSEIQATLQEQRILFLRQQIQHLEKMKNQNMFPS